MKSILISQLFTFLSFQTFAQETNKLDEKGQRHELWKEITKSQKDHAMKETFEHGKETGTSSFLMIQKS